MKIEKLIILLRLLKEHLRKATVFKTGCGAVGSVSGLGPEGRQFEPGHPDS